jgi:hypothetical protein
MAEGRGPRGSRGGALMVPALLDGRDGAHPLPHRPRDSGSPARRRVCTGEAAAFRSGVAASRRSHAERRAQSSAEMLPWLPDARRVRLFVCLVVCLFGCVLVCLCLRLVVSRAAICDGLARDWVPPAQLRPAAGTPRVPLEYPLVPLEYPLVPLEHPSSTPRVPLSTPRVPLEYPSSTPRVPLEYPSSTPRVPLSTPRLPPAQLRPPAGPTGLPLIARLFACFFGCARRLFVYLFATSATWRADAARHWAARACA